MITFWPYLTCFPFFCLLINCSGLVIKWLLFCPPMSWGNIWFTPLSTQSINWFAECLMMLLSDSHAFTAPNRATGCHLLGKKPSKPGESPGYHCEYLQSVHLITSPGSRRAAIQWLTHNDCGDGEQHECIPKKVTFNILLGDVLHFLLGQERALPDALLEPLHPAAGPRLLSAALGHPSLLWQALFFAPQRLGITLRARPLWCLRTHLERERKRQELRLQRGEVSELHTRRNWGQAA